MLRKYLRNQISDGFHRGEQAWNVLMVLDSSDKDAVCRYYLEGSARYAGIASGACLRHVRGAFVGVNVKGRFEISSS